MLLLPMWLTPTRNFGLIMVTYDNVITYMQMVFLFKCSHRLVKHNAAKLSFKDHLIYFQILKNNRAVKKFGNMVVIKIKNNRN